ncbi:MAG: hypothetical protein KKC39_00955 [Candidatus Omnitrophica bacterium]|nr:hypothetical protein [Candidatus Omnitrophota bacterium]
MSKLDKLFHIRKDISNRTIPSLPVLDAEGKWHIWLDRGDDLQEIKVVKPVESDYFAQKVDSKDDVFFDFLNFMYQKGTRSDVYPILQAIKDDMHNLSSCFVKLELFHRLKEEQQVDISRFAVTEIEYIFSVCRSLFDLFQIITKKYWNGIKLFEYKYPKRELKDSFGDMALKGEEIRSSMEIQSKFGLPSQWADFYVGEADFFKKIRKYRDNIHHRGLITDFIFHTPKGFAIRADYGPFACFNVWKAESFQQNNLAPIKPVIAFVVKETFAAMNRYVQMLAKIIQFPEEIAPGYYVFLRGYHINKLAKLEDYIENNVWYPEYK